MSNGYGQLEALEKIMAAPSDSTIKRVVSDWNVSAGVVTAKDVAFSTQRNRVAVKGSFDIAYDGSVPHPTGGSSSGHKQKIPANRDLRLLETFPVRIFRTLLPG